ncbi:MAG: DUF1674 domain-containing protein [Steroidobacteraceae bacterium]
MPEPTPTAAPEAEGEAAQNALPASGAQRAAGATDGMHRGPREIGGPPGPEPTRYGDWEKNGRCIDF